MKIRGSNSFKLPALLAAPMMALAFVACGPQTPDLMQLPTRGPGEKGVDAPVEAQIALAPKVDILFVIDTSESMDVHQEKLKANIGRFVEAFNKFTDVDFHIGVVSIYDHSRFDPVYGGTVPPTYPLGKLRPLKNPLQPGVPVNGVQYVTRGEGYQKILGETLNVGVEPREDAKGNDLGGPEKEELFTPVVPALSAQNGDFYRPDAHLAIVMITDTEDAGTTGLQADQLHQQLVELKGGDSSKISAYGALALNCDKVDPGLKKNGQIEQPQKLMDFVTISGGKYFNLCSQKGYGDQLAQVGEIIQQKASALVTIQLEERPEAKKGQMPVRLVVKEANGTLRPIPPGAAWAYDEDSNRVQINGDHPEIAKNRGSIQIVYTPVDTARYQRGKRVVNEPF